MAELKAEIGTFGKELGNLVQELKENQIKVKTDLEKKNDEMKDAVTTDLTALLNAVLLQDLRPSLTTSLKAMSKDITMEIGTFGKELGNLLQELKENQVKAETDLEKKIYEMKDAVTTDLTASSEAMSKNVTMVSDQCVSGIQSLTQKHDNNALNVNSAFQEMSLDMSKLSINVRKSSVNIVGELTEFTKETNDMLEAVADSLQRIDGIFVKGTVRIVNITQTETIIGGRLEVYYSGRWGSVCDDYFDITDANVACVSLGFTNAVTFKDKSFFGRSNNEFLMDNVQCTGFEKTLFDCERIGAGRGGSQDCDHNEYVGVICTK